MKIDELKTMIGGWFVGDFSPSAFHTKAAEVCCKHYNILSIWHRRIAKQ